MLKKPALALAIATTLLSIKVNDVKAYVLPVYNLQYFNIQRSYSFPYYSPFFQYPTGNIKPKTFTPSPTAKAKTYVQPAMAYTLATPAATPSPVPTVLADPGNSVKSYIMSEINTYRRSLGLYEFQTDSHTCSFAKTRAAEISTSFDHSGFSSRRANNTLPYPTFSKVTENIARTGNYQQVADMWINSAPHAQNLRNDTPYACVESYVNFYAFEGWKP
jgi:uncharacterized protein YkwD